MEVRNVLSSKILIILNTIMIACVIFVISEFACRISTVKDEGIELGGEKLQSISEAQACDDSSRCHDIVLAVGRIDSTMQRNLESYFVDKDMKKPLCFLSPGGYAESALAISRWLRNQGMPVCLAASYLYQGKHISISTDGKKIPCASACAYVFMSADVRISIGNNATLAVHGPRRVLAFCLCDIPISFGEVQYDTILTILEETKDPVHKERFYALHYKGIAIPNRELYRLTFPELEKYEVFTEYR